MEMLKLNVHESNALFFECENKHRYHIIDGVVDFRTRETLGEQWSLSYWNYDEYLHEHHWPGNPNYKRGLNPADVIFVKIQDSLKTTAPKFMVNFRYRTQISFLLKMKWLNGWLNMFIVPESLEAQYRISKKRTNGFSVPNRAEFNNRIVWLNAGLNHVYRNIRVRFLNGIGAGRLPKTT